MISYMTHQFYKLILFISDDLNSLSILGPYASAAKYFLARVADGN